LNSVVTYRDKVNPLAFITYLTVKSDKRKPGVPYYLKKEDQTMHLETIYHGINSNNYNTQQIALMCSAMESAQQQILIV
jgi:hypothetical protein